MKDMAEFDELRELDKQTLAALRDFRSSVTAWSEAEYSRPRTVLSPAHRSAWHRSLVWAMSLVLAAGVAGGGMYEHHHNQVVARVLEQQRLDQQRLAQQRQTEADKARETEDLLAKIDSDISRQVPSAMEPLAQLMNDSQ